MHAIDIISYIKINTSTEMHFLILIPIKITLTKNTIRIKTSIKAKPNRSDKLKMRYWQCFK